MKKLLLYIGVVIATVVAVDLAVGCAMHRYVASRPLPGDYSRIDYLLRDFDGELLILGNSVALNDFDPTILSDSLGLDTYNAGASGQTLTFHLALLKTLLLRHTPRIVMLGTTPSDLAREGAGPRVNLLAPYYGIGYAPIDSLLDSRSPNAPLLLKSSLYQYNTAWFRILLYHFVEPGVKGERGFVASDVPAVFPTKGIHPLDFTELSEGRRSEMQELIRLCRDRGIKLIVYFPPQYAEYAGKLRETDLYRDTERMLREAGMELHDHTTLEGLATDSTLFHDEYHLNLHGARRYTTQIVRQTLCEAAGLK